MKQYTIGLIGFLIASLLLLNSCGSSNSVVSNRLIQKRKYNKGWHFNSSKRIKSKSSSQEESLMLSKSETDNAIQIEKKEQVVVAETTPGSESETEVFSSEEKEEVANTNQEGISSNNISTIKAESPEESVTKRYSLRSEPEKLRLAKKAYNSTWMYTAMALVTLFAGIILAFNSYYLFFVIIGFVCLVIAVVEYIMMFVKLNRTVINLAKLNQEGYRNNKEISALTALSWLHVVVGSAFAILLFFIPLTILLITTNRAKKS